LEQNAPLTPEDETRLIHLAQRGDRKAFGDLVFAYRERALNGALSLVQNYEDARDLTQEAFVRAFKALKRFELGRPFYPWYYRILRNLCLTHLKRFGPSRQISLDQLVEEEHIQFASSDSADDTRDRIQQEEMAAHLRVAMEKLKPEFKEILAMKHFEEMSYEEIAQALRIPIGTVMSRLFHARKALAKLMEKYRP
jgi:RNA polymerase sigma-70 factor (ECF subfamily)